jgi:hypothetical protein
VIFFTFGVLAFSFSVFTVRVFVSSFLHSFELTFQFVNPCFNCVCQPFLTRFHQHLVRTAQVVHSMDEAFVLLSSFTFFRVFS